MTRAFETLLRCFFLKCSALSYMKPLILCPPHAKISASFLLYPSASPKEEKVINGYQDSAFQNTKLGETLLNKMLPDAFENISFYS